MNDNKITFIAGMGQVLDRAWTKHFSTKHLEGIGLKHSHNSEIGEKVIQRQLNPAEEDQIKEAMLNLRPCVEAF